MTPDTAKSPNWLRLLFALILLLAALTRFYDLGARVMSHDESLHTYFSWQLATGAGYKHDPMMHGPFQFHAVALSYFLFGDNDATARIPAVLFSIASVAFLWAYRRYLGRAGTLIAAFLFVISPYMLYYGRYVRNEAFVAFWGLVTLWATLRYLEDGEKRSLLILSAVTALHLTTKETGFIYTAQLLVFLGLLFLSHILNQDWQVPPRRTLFLVMLAAGVSFFAVSGGFMQLGKATIVESSLTQPTAPGATPESTQIHMDVPPLFTAGAALLGGISLLAALGFLAGGYGLEALRRERSLDLMVLLLTLILPQLAPLPVKLMGWPIPDQPGAIYGLGWGDVIHFAVFMLPLALIGMAAGVWWLGPAWWQNAAAFYLPFTLFYTTFFTNGGGFFSGMVGSLAYWLAQQGVQRGGQPWYYYLVVQIPLYEYLPFLASLVGVWYLARSTKDGARRTEDGQPSTVLFPLLAFYWSATSLLAYSVAGEKMPWLTVHIALPLILLGGWGLGQLFERIPAETWQRSETWQTLALALVFILSASRAIGSLLGEAPPFHGKDLAALQATSNFIVALAAAGLSAWGLAHLRGRVEAFGRVSAAAFFALLAAFTIHTAFQAAYQNYDQANEYLVYAHSARGVKDVLARVEDLSLRLTDGLDIEVAYDDDTSWPMTWYLRHYRKQRFYGAQPTRDLQSAPLIIVGDNSYGKIEAVVRQDYYRFDYIRMVWPEQDYFGLNRQRIMDALHNPAMRRALWDIWLNRDHTRYGQVLGKDMSLTNWNPADRMRLYIRKDVAAQLWDYAAQGEVAQTVAIDPYEGKQVTLEAARILGGAYPPQGVFVSPRGIALAPDGTLYVTDTETQQVIHLTADGEILDRWGAFGDILNGAAPAGTFNQPWGVAVGPDGSVYVADTWNHRIQKFTASGQFITMWGVFGQAETSDAFWGPRDVVVDANGRVFVSDTGNKRIAVFDADGNFITQFGAYGVDAGQFDEPVGLALDSVGHVYVTDTWNQRVQVFEESTPNTFVPLNTWDMAAWYGEALDNKPYAAVLANGHVVVSDPEGYRLIEFTPQGEAVQVWGNLGSGPAQFGLPIGLAAAPDGGLWVADAANGRVMFFQPAGGEPMP
ncbi:MAG: hypothetical protein Fur0018_03550 [Anaerolineales bacterium]